jgi:RNA polymerase sigma-70 factor (ECF subfamily)
MIVLRRALRAEALDSYTIQAAIAAEHAAASSMEQTNWTRITGWYDLLLQASPSPIVELNRAVAVAMATSPDRGLRLIEDLEKRGALTDYHHLHAAKADLLRRSGLREAARESYAAALNLATQEPQRRFLEMRLDEV